jgi:hypothetical protein
MQHPAIKRLHWLGYSEAFSWLILLLVAMPFKIHLEQAPFGYVCWVDSWNTFYSLLYSPYTCNKNITLAFEETFHRWFSRFPAFWYSLVC